jgi:hypothetical protein
MDRACATDPPVDPEQNEHQDDEHGAEAGRACAVEARLVGDVDLARERVEAHDRDRSEVAHHVESDEQPPRGERGPELRQSDGAEGRERAATHRPRGVLELRVDPPQRRPDGYQHERIREQGQHQPGAEEPVDRRQALDTERVLKHPVRAERGDEQIGADVARDHERQRAQRRPHAPAGEVGPHGQPAERQRDCDRARGHRRDQRQRSREHRGCARVERGVERAADVVDDEDHEVERG